MEHFAKKNLKAGEVLIKEGEKSNDLYLLMNGCLKVTINKGTSELGKTQIGSNVLLMASTHVAHDCLISNNIVLAC